MSKYSPHPEQAREDEDSEIMTYKKKRFTSVESSRETLKRILTYYVTRAKREGMTSP